MSLPHLDNAESIILVARKYALALELIETRPEFSYQSLISCIETVASSISDYFQPTETHMVETKKSVYNLALQYGLNEDQAKALAVSACKGIGWTKQKFIKFLSDYITDELWTKDDVSIDMEYLTPKKERFEPALNKIYGIRSKDLHTGKHYPLTATVGASPKLPPKIMLEMGDLKQKPFPLPARRLRGLKGW